MRQPPGTLLVVAAAALSLAVALGTWQAAESQQESEARGRLEFRVREIAQDLRGRMLDYEQVLRGTLGLLAASRQVTAQEWQTYVTTLQLDSSYPGIQSIGYAPYLRKSGAATAPVRYIEPLARGNQRVLGFDLLSEPERRRAVERARDTGEAVLTGRLTLRSESSDAGPPGFIMVLPAYRGGVVPASLEERRARFAAVVYGAFRTTDLFRGTIGEPSGLHLRLFDATEPPQLLYEDERDEGRPRYQQTESIVVRGRTWRLEAKTRPALEALITGDRARLILSAGIALSALFTALVWSLVNTRARASELARGMVAAGEELRNSEARLALSLESSGIALFDWDLQSGLVHLGKEWRLLLGGEAQATVMPIQKLEQLVHTDDLPAQQAQLRKLLTGEIATYRVEHRVRALDGQWKWIESVAKVSGRDADGRATRVTGTNSDISLRRALGDLKNAFIANVSHELRTPLTGIVASLDLLKDGSAGQLPEQARQFVDIAYGNSERLGSLISDILDLEQIETGRLRLAIRPVAVGELLARTMDLNTPYAERYQARMVRRDAPPGLQALADEDRLLQVLTNLVSNAAKHSPPGGEIVLAARAEGEQVVFSVADQGEGIAEEFKPRIFGKFEQADHSKPGTGLGLAIAKAMVEKMGGGIRFESERGRGATFYVELPIARP